MSEKISPSVINNEHGVESLTLLAFVMVALLGGSNVVAVRFSNFGLPPFWGAAFRFASAGLIFWAIVLIKRIKVPKGRALVGVLVYGALSVGISYAFLYWGLVYLPASMSAIVLAFAPLLTFFFALAHGQEKFRWQGLVGGVVAFAGILVILSNQVGSSLPLLPVLALVAGVASISEANVIYKSFPKTDPWVVNAVSLTIGVAILVALSLFAGETWRLPDTATTWAAYLYLVLGGSVLLFYLYLYVLSRWTASTTTYIFLLMPLVSIGLAAWLAGESITSRFLLGGVLALVGVWVGAFMKPKERHSAQQKEPRVSEG